MDYEWDDRKADSNLAKHFVAFGDAVRVFNDSKMLTLNAYREVDREVRFKAVGRLGPSLYAVIFTVRGDVRRIISARRANANEEKRYGDRALQTRSE